MEQVKSNVLVDKGEENIYTEAQIARFSAESKLAELTEKLTNSTDAFIKLVEDYFAANGEGEIKEVATERRDIRYQLDELGKIVQSATGNGTPFDPYKTWSEGKEVKEGDWWLTDDNHIWQAIKSGVPASSTDSEYWDIPAWRIN